MTRITKPRRGRRPVRRLDLEPMREALRDRRMWTMLGVVRAPSGGSSHWEVVPNKAGAEADIHVEVELQPSGERVSARLPAGMWVVPAIGDEVAVLVPDGDIAFMSVIACVLAHALPSDQGPTPQRIVIARPGTEVVIHDGSGGAKALATVDHFHLDSTGSPTGGPIVTAIPNAPNPLYPTTDPVNPYLDEIGVPTTHPYHEGDADGTTVLKAK